MNPPSFYPPRLNPLLTRVLQSFSYGFAHLFYNLELKVDSDSIARLKELGSERIVLLPNHSRFDDAISLFLFSARWGELFHYLVAYDTFKGFLAGFLPRMGSYSIQRGVGDRLSIACTLKLLQQPGIRLVIFPEGGCSFQNDTVMPFRTGAVQLPFQAMNQLAKSSENVPDLWVVPLSLKYRYLRNIQPIIEDSFQRLEAALQISQNQDFYSRLRAIAEQVLVRLEAEYKLNPPENPENWNARFLRLKTYVLEKCEDILQLPHNPSLPDRERVYKIQATLEDRAQDWGKPQHETYSFINKSAFRLLNFDAIYDGYVAAYPTQERYLDTLTRLEREIFAIDQPPAKAPRQVMIKIGEPVNLKDHFQSYRNNRLETIESLTLHFQQAVQKNLDPINLMEVNS